MEFRYKRPLQALPGLCVVLLVWERATFFVLHFVQLFLMPIGCVFARIMCYSILTRHNGADHSDANE